MSHPPTKKRPLQSTRSVWCLLVIAAGCVAVAKLGVTTLAEQPVRRGVDRAHETNLIDPLQASCAELQLLPGIGPSLARSMHREIHTAELATLDNLETLPGIGPVRAERIRGAVAPRTDD